MKVIQNLITKIFILKKTLIIFVCFFCITYSQCDNLVFEWECNDAVGCEWLENISYGDCSNLSTNNCNGNSSCYWNADIETINCSTLPTYGAGPGDCEYYYPDCYEYLDYGGSYGSWSTACGGGIIQVDNSLCLGGSYEIENLSYCSDLIEECIYSPYIEIFDSECFPANQNAPYYYDTTIGSHTPGTWEGSCDGWNFTYENGWTSSTDLYGSTHWNSYVASFPFIVYETAENAWHQSTYNSYDGNNYWCADEGGSGYDNEWVQYLDTPILFISDNSELSVDMTWNIEPWQGAAVSGTCVDGWDQANVQISTNGGQSFEILHGSTLYNFECGYGSVYNGFTGMPGWGGSRNWHTVSFDLTQYANENIIIRFAFYSDPAVTNLGFQIDNIKISQNQSDDYIFLDNAENEFFMQTAGNMNYLSVHMVGNNWGGLDTEWGKISTAKTPYLDINLCDDNLISYNYNISDNALMRTYIETYNDDFLIASHNSLSSGQLLFNLNDYIENSNDIRIRFESESNGYSSNYTPPITTVKNLYLPPIMGTEPIFFQGDLNSDSFINVLDIILVVYLILDNEYQHLADLNNDNLVNIIDIVTIVDIILQG